MLDSKSEDIDKLQKILSSQDCLDTFKDVIERAFSKADQASLQRAEKAVTNLFSSIDNWRLNPRELDHVAWDLYPKFVKAYSLLRGQNLPVHSQFPKLGFAKGELDEALNTALVNELQKAHPIPFMTEDSNLNYDAGQVDHHTEQMLNDSHNYYMLEEGQLLALQGALTSIETEIAECIGMPWRVVNVRVSATLPQAKEAGPNEWHLDGMHFSVWKMMIYPRGVGGGKGTTELDLGTEKFSIEGGPGTWLIFKNSEVLHRGVPPKSNERLIVEVAIVPALVSDMFPRCGGLNARYPKLPWQYPQTAPPMEKEVQGINVGGGPDWSAPDWINLEEVKSSINPEPYYLHPNCHFPVKDESVQTVYTSHAIEHLTLPTVYRILSEAHRVLKKDGDLLIKIPDYDKVLDYWRRQDSSFFDSDWGIESVSQSWSRMGVCDCLNHRAAMIMCSFFNKENPFGFAESKVNKKTKVSYFGPPRVKVRHLKELIHPKHNRTPAEVARELRKLVKNKEPMIQFCHQSAWSRTELKTLLVKFGFEVATFDPSIIENTFETIPGMNEMKDISMFCWARKK